MAHAQKTYFVFRRNGLVHLNRRGASIQSTTGSRGVRFSGGNAGYTVFRGSVKSTGYPLLSPVSSSIPLPCVTVCHHISTGVYLLFGDQLNPSDIRMMMMIMMMMIILKITIRNMHVNRCCNSWRQKCDQERSGEDFKILQKFSACGN